MSCMLKIYVAKANDLCQDLVYAPFELLTEERKKKVLALRGEEDRRRGIAAGLLLREALKREHISCEDATFIKDVHQKPYLKNKACFFNLSHAKNWVVCAISDVPVGIDVETKDRFLDPEKNQRLARRILTAEEWMLWSRADSGRELLCYWTKKESSAKRTGQGLSVDFRQIDTLHGDWYGTRSLSDDAQMSVCTKEPQEHPEWIWITQNGGETCEFEWKMLD